MSTTAAAPTGDLAPFRNEPILELRRASERQRLLDALAWLEPRLPVRAPVWIGDERRDGDDHERVGADREADDDDENAEEGQHESTTGR